MVKETSRMALKELEESGKAGIQRAAILKFLITHPRKQGWSRRELQRETKIDINAVTPRVFNLLEAELIEECGNKVCTVTARYVGALRAK